MADSLKARVRVKLLRQMSEDGRPDSVSEADDSRLNSIAYDLAVLDDAHEDDPVVEEMAARYWVP